MNKYAGERYFLESVDKNFPNSTIMKNSGKGVNKYEDVDLYYERIRDIEKRARKELIDYAYYSKHVIKPENVPSSHFELKRRAALENENRHILFDDKEIKKEIASIRKKQKDSLNVWRDYLNSEAAEHFPGWFKLYCFAGMTKIGHLDKEKGKFTKRTKKTVYPFVELNEEGIEFIYTELMKYLDNKEVDDDYLDELLKSGSFPKLYAYFLKKNEELLRQTSDINDGVWKEYGRYDGEKLSSDLQGKGTGWCVADKETACRYSKRGGFLVYYTKDQVGEYTQPRVAIRIEKEKDNGESLTEGDFSIGEIRGILAGQNLEGECVDVLDLELKKINHEEEYLNKIEQVRKVNKMYDKWQNKEDFSLENLVFLYQIKEDIEGFAVGKSPDPRIAEMLSQRNNVADLNEIFSSISTNDYNSNLDFSIFGDLSGLVFPKEFYSNLNLSGLENIDNIIFPEIIHGDFNVSNVKHISDYSALPKRVDGSVYFFGIEDLEDFDFDMEVGGAFDIGGVKVAENGRFPEKIGFEFNAPNVEKMSNVVLPKTVVWAVRMYNLDEVENCVVPEDFKWKNFYAKKFKNNKDIFIEACKGNGKRL